MCQVVAYKRLKPVENNTTLKPKMDVVAYERFWLEGFD